MPSNFTPAARELFFLILVRGRTWRALLPRGPKRLASSAPHSRTRPETARPQHDTFSPAGPPPPPAGRELLCISSYRAARNGTPAARGPTQHARSASRSCVQPETARSLRAVLPAGLNLYPILYPILLSIDLPIYQSLYLPLYLLSIYLSIYLFLYLFIYLAVICLSIYKSIYLCLSLFLYLFLSISLAISISVY